MYQLTLLILLSASLCWPVVNGLVMPLPFAFLALARIARSFAVVNWMAWSFLTGLAPVIEQKYRLETVSKTVLIRA